LTSSSCENKDRINQSISVINLVLFGGKSKLVVRWKSPDRGVEISAGISRNTEKNSPLENPEQGPGTIELRNRCLSGRRRMIIN
jgi:hypothetical protein